MKTIPTLDQVAINLETVTLPDLLAELGRRLAMVGGAAAKDADTDDLQLLDAHDVSGLLKIPVARVYEMQRRGEIGSVGAGRTVRFSRADVAAYLKAHERKPR